MLMNLTRMREFNWISQLAPVLEKYRLYLTWGDQDIINVIFHDHPGKFPIQFYNNTNILRRMILVLIEVMFYFR